MLQNVLVIAACILPQRAICAVQEDSQEEDGRSRSVGFHDPRGQFCTQLGSSHDQCDAHPHKCQWNWYGEGHPDNGCVKTECFGKSADACAAAERCTWKASGRWKGLCIANSCAWRNDSPSKCDTRPCNQCLFDHVLRACLPNPDQSESGAPLRNPSNMWSLPWAPGSGTTKMLNAMDDVALLAGPQCGSISYDRDKCDANAHKCMWSEEHGCVSSGCSYWQIAAECMGPCTWKSEGRWKGHCVTNTCIKYSEDPGKCNSMPENQCRYSLGIQRCVPNLFEQARHPFLAPRLLPSPMYSSEVRPHNVPQVTQNRGERRLPLVTVALVEHWFSNGVTVALLICVAAVAAAVAFVLYSWSSSAKPWSTRR